ncbi:MAG TPA: ABC transporter permease [Nitrososphaerales archaeon]|nr:ABC transporter permease [Nitrososphaerales archaeon]
MLEKARVLTAREIRGWIRSPFLAISFLIRPVLWVFVFGGALNAAFFGGSSQNALGGASNYFSYLAVGMLSAMPMLLATRAGSSLFADRSGGYLDRLLVAPVSRSTIALTKVFGTVLFGLSQSIVLLVIAIPFGLEVSNLSPTSVLASLMGVFLLAWGYSAFFMVLSFRIKRWADMQLIASLNFPIMLFSKVFYPSSRLPSWMSTLTAYNPVSFSADISRTLMFGTDGAVSSLPVVTGFVVLFAFAFLTSALVLVLAKEWL